MPLFFEELPKAEHDELVRKYWTTWLAAMGWGAKNEAAFAAFVSKCERLVGELIVSDGDTHDGIGDEDRERTFAGGVFALFLEEAEEVFDDDHGGVDDDAEEVERRRRHGARRRVVREPFHAQENPVEEELRRERGDRETAQGGAERCAARAPPLCIQDPDHARYSPRHAGSQQLIAASGHLVGDRLTK